MTTHHPQAIASTIYQQFGGGRASAMIGMYGQGYGTDASGNPYLSFSFKAGRKANYCTITLNAMDTYNMVIEKVSRMSKDPYIKRKVVADHKGVYGDQLKPLFEVATGLLLQLF